jgi:hypothetical protein
MVSGVLFDSAEALLVRACEGLRIMRLQALHASTVGQLSLVQARWWWRGMRQCEVSSRASFVNREVHACSGVYVLRSWAGVLKFAHTPLLTCSPHRALQLSTVKHCHSPVTLAHAA